MLPLFRGVCSQNMLTPTVLRLCYYFIHNINYYTTKSTHFKVLLFTLLQVK